MKIGVVDDPGAPTGTSPPGDPAVWPDGFADFYAAQWAPMVRLAHLLMGGEGEAEELVQDAFLRFRGHVEAVEHPAAYLRTSVVNACISDGRRRGRERRVMSGLTTAAETVDHPDELRDALRRLPDRQRTVIVLRYYTDLPEREIAAALGCSVTAVKSLLHRALRALRGVIEP